MLRGWGAKERPLRDHEGAPREVEGNPEHVIPWKPEKSFRGKGLSESSGDKRSSKMKTDNRP